ncbi:protein-disulfide reductase DsbD domain-containing protein [Bartonella machadoae]|uniref:protein-disulfide reductase DsbD domain-containing protein n=1 Tax=Bartonella machadoae TaxID=2893471 RepID=UPI001F4CD1E3|nr:protein-disulfide reductase DsbD domain-containing protein [Bartonella machadoae]UNE54885.1 hypothetical protein LNM86_03225 [Bartonella machadoae]
MKKIQTFISSQNSVIALYKRLLVTVSLTFIILELLNFSVSAQTKPNSDLFATSWYESEGGRIRLALTEPSPSGIREGMIEIVLKPNWKTYWRNPGYSGIAAFFNFNQQVSYEIFYPTPQLYETENDWSFGYKDKVVLPFTLSGLTNNLSGTLTVGLCYKICLPFTVNFDFSPSIQKKQRLPLSLLKAAQDALPRTTHHEIKISAEKKINTLFIKIQNNDATPLHSLFLDGGDMQIGPAKKVRESANYILFSAPIYFIPNEENHTIFYTVSFKSHALSGTFTLYQ